MKRYILDTNIIIKDSSLLTKWSSNYRLIIPDVIFEETIKVYGRLTDSKSLIHLIENSESKGFIKIVNINRNKYDFSERISENFDISYIDFQIAQFAKDYSKNNPDTFLVTDDRKLTAYAEYLGIKTQNLFGFQSDIRSNKTVDISEIGTTSNIKKFQFRHLTISFFSGISLTILSYLVYKNFDTLTKQFPVWGTITILTVIPFIFYWFRSNLRIAYAIAEFSFGYLSVLYVTSPFAADFEISNIYKITVVIPILGGIYVMVRGLDNFSKGLQGTLLERPWKKMFKD
ncbi:PIN domain-containing protein [Chryseobacterium nepalense]|uniref:PIN domain-containing protein n=1 Tax=Chryseobacterium nepalense TaxID=1854498 RepID=UPI002E057E0E|nr:putative nucleic acid-binding protein [Chryseobacterium nepalense]